MDSIQFAQPAPSVLLAEPHDLLRLGARQVLRDLGCTVWATDNGDDALGYGLAAPAPLALLVLDTRLPGVDGVSVAHTLRARWPSVAVMFLANREIVRPPWQHGLPQPCSVLENPAHPDLLVSVARRLLTSTGFRLDQPLRTGLSESPDEPYGKITMT